MTLSSSLNQDTLASCVIIGIIAFVGLIGNSLMLRALIKYEQLRVDVYVIFGSLALADMLHLCFAGPAKIIYTVQASEITTDAWCKISRFITNATGYIAAYHIVVLSVVRGIVLTNRGHSPPTAKHALISSAVLWALGFLASIPVFFTYKRDSYSQMCEVSTTANLSTTVWLEGAFTFFLPIFLIIALYGLTHYVGKRYFEDSYSEYARKMSRLINAVVIAFLVCQFPYEIINLHVFYEEQKVEELLREYPNYDYTYVVTLFTISDYLYCLLLAGKCLRPVIYSKLSADLGECFDEVINCTYCSKYYHTGASVRNRGSNLQIPLTVDRRDDTREQVQLEHDS